MNKQCPGRDLVVLLMRVTLVELFLRYDTFTVEIGKPLLALLIPWGLKLSRIWND